MIREGSEAGGATRAFVALDLDEASVEIVMRAASALRASTPHGVKGRWTPREQMHVTVKFLGDVSDPVLAGIGGAVRSRAGTELPRRATFESVGGFPSVARATVLVGLIEDAGGTLASLARAFEEHAQALGIAPEERAYRPHVTLARLGVPREVRAWIAGVELAKSDLTFAALALYRSDRGPAGPRYTALARAPIA